MAGVSEISKEIPARCPHCHHSLNLQQLGRELFRRILDRLKGGQAVEAEGFGRFRTHIMPARKVSGLKSKVTEIPERRVLRFKTSGHAKTVLNEDMKDKQTGRKKWRKKRRRSS